MCGMPAHGRPPTHDAASIDYDVEMIVAAGTSRELGYPLGFEVI